MLECSSGKILHLVTMVLSIQHHVGRRNLQIHKVARSEHKADSGTKGGNAETLTKLMKAMNLEEATVRPTRALKVVLDQGSFSFTEIMNGNKITNDEEDNETTQVEHGR